MKLTSVQISTTTKSILDQYKEKGQSYEDVIKTLLKPTRTEKDGYVKLVMTKEEYTALRNRQVWPVCDEILIRARVD